MTERRSEDRLERARQAASRGEWAEAHALFAEAHDDQPLQVEDLAFFAGVAYAAGHLEITIELWERAHADAVRVGDALAAAGAAVRVAMHLLLDSGLMAPVRGWLSRAERHLQGQPEGAIHAW